MRMRLVELAAHVDLLRALAGEEKRHAALPVLRVAGEDLAGFDSLENVRRASGAYGDPGAPMAKGAAAGLQRVGRRRPAMSSGLQREMLGEPLRRCIERRRGLRREHEELRLGRLP